MPLGVDDCWKKASDYVEFHLVVEEGMQGTLYIEAWRDQARRATQ